MKGGVFESVVNHLEVVVLRAVPMDSNWSLESVNSEPPDWFSLCFGSDREILERSPFIDDFFHGQAMEFWLNGNDSSEPLHSGIWEESSQSGVGHFFQARAILVGDGNFLLIQCVDDQHAHEQKWSQHSHEEALQRRRLAKEQEKKEILLNCIVHDLSSPLSTILMNIQHVSRQLERDDLRNVLDRALSQAQRQRRLIQSVTGIFSSELSLLESIIPGGESRTNIAAIAAEAITCHAPEASMKQVELSVEISGEADGETPEVAGDSEHLTRIFDNLISNAIRHSPAKGKIQIHLISDSGDVVRCEVLDEGSGVDPSFRESIFKPFSQGQAETGQSGLGLYFCRMVIELWGGKIGMTPRQEKGSCFWFELPTAEKGELK